MRPLGVPYVDRASGQYPGLALDAAGAERDCRAGPVGPGRCTPGRDRQVVVNRVLALIATGRSAAIMTAPAGDEEFRKKITATLLSGTSLILLDNVAALLRCLAGSLAAALTTGPWSDRILGQVRWSLRRKSPGWPPATISASRAISPAAALDSPGCPDLGPGNAPGFRQPDLLGWVRYRGELVTALLTLSQAWYPGGPTRGRDADARRL